MLERPAAVGMPAAFSGLTAGEWFQWTPLGIVVSGVIVFMPYLLMATVASALRLLFS